MGNARNKPQGWHSRRNEYRKAQEQARETYQEGRGPNMKKGRRRQKSGVKKKPSKRVYL